MREIKLITAATKNPQIPQINMTQCDFLMCSDVLTDSVHLRRIWGNACHPRRTCKIQWAESTNLKKKKEKKKQLSSFGWCQTYFATKHFCHSYESVTMTGLILAAVKVTCFSFSLKSLQLTITGLTNQQFRLCRGGWGEEG